MATTSIITLIFTIKDRKYRNEEFKKQIKRDKVQYWIKKSEFKLNNAREYEDRIEKLRMRIDLDNNQFVNARALSNFSGLLEDEIVYYQNLHDSEMKKYNSYIKKINAYFEENEEE